MKDCSPEDLQAIFEAVKSNTFCYKAAAHFNMPRETLARHLVNIKSSKINKDCSIQLTCDQERHLVTIVKIFFEFGFSLNKTKFMELAEQYIEKYDQSSIFVNGKPGED